jgi:uracil-DNA glycosylase
VETPGFFYIQIMNELLKDIKACRVCEDFLDLGPNPVVAADPQSRVVIIGQAPGLAVHESGIPWDDKSGDNLRNWMDVDKEVFYDTTKIALIPMGFCYPGKGKSGDLPPRPECAPLWHEQLLGSLKNIELILLVGKYAQDHYLGEGAHGTLTETVKDFKSYLPEYLVLPHPSPRNNIWQAKNPWFREEIIPYLQTRIKQIFSG